MTEREPPVRPHPIFVFGSNLAGRHGAGAALTAVKHRGAIYGKGVGHHGNSYAIPTKDCSLHTLPLDEIKLGVDEFIRYTKSMLVVAPNLRFQVTAIGCGLAGYGHHQIAPMFAEAIDTCSFDWAWRPYLGEEREYWGHWE